jgi:hydroxymethylpyrimidine/phosphomethylpyrimidine kinase
MPLYESQQNTPVVMTFSDHNSCGGSGIQADVETLFSIGCHCSSVPTALTAQDTHEFKDTFATEPAILIGQARAVLEDMMVAAFKIGRNESVRNIEVIHTILTDYPEQPVILEPAFTSLNRSVSRRTIDATRSLLLPLATIVTVNVQESHFLASNCDNLDACAHEILDNGCKYVLISGTNTDVNTVTNSLYSVAGNIKSWEWPRLPHLYLGSGSTLAASLAGYMAHDLDIVSAAQQAQSYTWNSLKNGRRMGMGQHIPNRMFWAN